MAPDDPTPDQPEVQRAMEEMAGRFASLTFHPDADGVRHPYVTGTLPGSSAPVEILRSSRWRHRAIAIHLGSGPFGPWAKPRVPDPDHQEGGLTFLPNHEVPEPDGFLAPFPEAQSFLHELWLNAKPEASAEHRPDGLAIVMRPDAVMAHLRTPAVTPDHLECLLQHLPAVSDAARAHDRGWSETVHPSRDRWLWPALWVTLVVALGALAYLAAIH